MTASSAPSQANERLAAVQARLEAAARQSGRALSDVKLLAVSKIQPIEKIRALYAAGQRAFGENYVREATGKMDALAGSLGKERARALEWHLIGPLQSNKTRPVAERFDWVHTVESEKVARRLSEQRPAGMVPLNVLIQVNVSGEASKSGISPAEVAGLVAVIAPLSGLKLRGLMAIPEPTADTGLQRSRFSEVKRLMEKLRFQGFELDTLSMGMSDDIEAAIAEGATMVRVGTAIFGARHKVRTAA